MRPAELLIVKAFAYFCKGDYQSAMHIYDEILKNKRDASMGVLVDALIGKGRIFIKLGNYSGARSLIEMLKDLTVVSYESFTSSHYPLYTGLQVASINEIWKYYGDVLLAEIDMAEKINDRIYSRLFKAFQAIEIICSSKQSEPPAILIEALSLLVDSLFMNNNSHKSLKQHIGMEKAQLAKSLRASYLRDPKYDLLKTMWTIKYYQHRRLYEGGLLNNVRLMYLAIQKYFLIKRILS